VCAKPLNFTYANLRAQVTATQFLSYSKLNQLKATKCFD
jgi:hypothetical protein